jgi:hypothetical protein
LLLSVHDVLQRAANLLVFIKKWNPEWVVNSQLHKMLLDDISKLRITEKSAENSAR